MTTCDLCEHEKDQHWTININTGLTMNGPCKDTDYEDAESYPCMCDYFEPKKEEVKTTTRKLDICDDCSLVAHDAGIDGWDNQVETMVTIGEVVSDHLCTAKEEPDLDIQCDCGCNPKRFEWHRKQRRKDNGVRSNTN
jgi:hypothetical protein